MRRILFFLMRYEDEISSDDINILDVVKDDYLNKAAKMGCKNAIEFCDKVNNIINVKEQNDSSNTPPISMKNVRRNAYPVNVELDGVKFCPSYLGQQFAEKLSISYLPYLTLTQIIDFLDSAYKKAGVEALFLKAKFVSGGVRNAVTAKLFTGESWRYGSILNKQEYRAIHVSSCNEGYCNQLWIMDGSDIYFFFVGESKAFYEVNQYEAINNGKYDEANFLTKIKSFVGVGPDMDRYNKEIQWHSDVYGLFCALNE